MPKDKEYQHFKTSSPEVCAYIDKYLEWLDGLSLLELLGEWERVRQEIMGNRKMEVREEWLTK